MKIQAYSLTPGGLWEENKGRGKATAITQKGTQKTEAFYYAKIYIILMKARKYS